MKRVAALAGALSIFVSAAEGAQCKASSGPNTAALVELYTSEGCSSCPPADRWLSSLAAGGQVPGSVVPLALHVDYWDYIGWKDPYAKREFSLRQRKLSQLQRMALVYTPQVLLQGRDFRGWGTPAFDAAVAKITRQPAKAQISLAVRQGAGRMLQVEAGAALLDAGQQADAALYLAAYESRLASKVTAGENRGRTTTWCWSGRGRSASARSHGSRSGGNSRCCRGPRPATPGWWHSCRTGAQPRCCRP